MNEEIPVWPEFRILPHVTEGVYKVSTSTMRPPVVNGRGQTFSILITTDDDHFARHELDRVYRMAHPSGCAINRPA